MSEQGADRLLAIYGGRAAAIVDLAMTDDELQKTLDSDGHLLAAEVVFTIREEFATTLADIVFRRMMIGFDADQGRPHYEAIASRVASELKWSSDVLRMELDELVDYADSLRVVR
jgi:glycerol-3-phosphate dehydrogenase